MTTKFIISALLGAFFITTVPANAATFVVNETLDNEDANQGDGLCAVSSTGNCSLRAAIQEANAIAGADTILLGPGEFTLTRAGVDDDFAATGDLDIRDGVTIRGAGRDSTVISGGFLDRVFDVIAPGGNVSLNDLEVRYGSTNHVGGGIRNEDSLSLSLVGVSIYGNLAAHGAGLHSIPGVFLKDSEVAYNFTNSTGCGGGITITSGVLTVQGSSIHHNGAGSGGLGGGICNFGTAEGTNWLFIQRSTISDNTPDGVGANNALGDTLMVIDGSTIADNGFFGIRTLNTGTPPEISCSIVSGHLTADCSSETVPPIVGGGYTLSQDGSCSDVSTDLAGDPLLGPLVGGSGRTRARAPFVGSPAIDGGANSICPTTDQWGRPRTMDGDQNGTPIADIGALEDVLLFTDGFESGDATAWSQVAP